MPLKRSSRRPNIILKDGQQVQQRLREHFNGAEITLCCISCSCKKLSTAFRVAFRQHREQQRCCGFGMDSKILGAETQQDGNAYSANTSSRQRSYRYHCGRSGCDCRDCRSCSGGRAGWVHRSWCRCSWLYGSSLVCQRRADAPRYLL